MPSELPFCLLNIAFWDPHLVILCFSNPPNGLCGAQRGRRDPTHFANLTSTQHGTARTTAPQENTEGRKNRSYGTGKGTTRFPHSVQSAPANSQGPPQPTYPGQFPGWQTDESALLLDCSFRERSSTDTSSGRGVPTAQLHGPIVHFLISSLSWSLSHVHII